jgi:hypothetical protein
VTLLLAGLPRGSEGMLTSCISTPVGSRLSTILLASSVRFPTLRAALAVPGRSKGVTEPRGRLLRCMSLKVARAGRHPGRAPGPLSGVDLPPERWP